ncbi:hydrogenase maturation protease [Magnetovibrio sp.]|uniref:hydrogenase maturation protease n=1 Tax=Magnetovibrio sp. TaxID=2024836 RepID=UPI002F92CEFA
MTERTPWIIGVGNALRGDDGAAAAVVARLRTDDIPAYVFDGDGAELMEMWQGQGRVIVIDAALSGAPPGTLHRFEANFEELPRNFFRHSTHQFGVAEAVEMARTLGRLPGELIVYGIEGARFDLGAPLSPGVEQGVYNAVAQIKVDIAEVLS